LNGAKREMMYTTSSAKAAVTLKLLAMKIMSGPLGDLRVEIA
jgi:hypothetical protein